MELKYWSDPFIEGENRTPTPLDFPGFRLRWGRIFQTNFEVTLTARKYQFTDERSGEWLVEQGRLNPEELASLNRNGEFLEVIAGYKIKPGQHQLQPMFRYSSSNQKGRAIANNRSSIILDYIYRSPKMVLDARKIYKKREADHIHPVFDEKANSNGYGFVIGAAFPVILFNSPNWNFTVGGEYTRENFNIDFLYISHRTCDCWPTLAKKKLTNYSAWVYTFAQMNFYVKGRYWSDRSRLDAPILDTFAIIPIFYRL